MCRARKREKVRGIRKKGESHVPVNIPFVEDKSVQRAVRADNAVRTLHDRL